MLILIQICWNWVKWWLSNFFIKRKFKKYWFLEVRTWCDSLYFQKRKEKKIRNKADKVKYFEPKSYFKRFETGCDHCDWSDRTSIFRRFAQVRNERFRVFGAEMYCGHDAEHRIQCFFSQKSRVNLWKIPWFLKNRGSDRIKFRHYDHKYEFTRQEFRNWCNAICLNYSNIDIRFPIYSVFSVKFIFFLIILYQYPWFFSNI